MHVCIPTGGVHDAPFHVYVPHVPVQPPLEELLDDELEEDELLDELELDELLDAHSVQPPPVPAA